MADLQEMTTALENSVLKVGLNISNEKTETMQVFAQDPTTKMFIKKEEVADVSCFTYLGSIFTADGDAEADINCRIGKASTAFKRMQPIWPNNSIDTKIKIRFSPSLILPTMLYACETWKTNAKVKKKLDVFLTRCLRKILKISYRDRVTNEEVYQQTKARPLSLMIKERRLRYAGHVLRMKEQRASNTAIRWVPEGKRKRKRPKNTWRRTFYKDLEEIECASKRS